MIGKANTRSGDAAKWLIGCCGGAVLMLLVCGGALWWIVPKVAKPFMAAIESGIEAVAEREQARNALADAWNPLNAEAPTEELFPESVGDFFRTEIQEDVVLNEFGLSASAPLARYGGPNGDVSLSLIRVDEEELDATFENLKRAIDTSGYTSKIAYGGTGVNRYYFLVSPPQRNGWFWWIQGWLIVAVAEGEFDPEPFLMAYLSLRAGSTDIPEEESAPEQDPSQLEDSSELETTPAADAQPPSDPESAINEAPADEAQPTDAEPRAEADAPDEPTAPMPAERSSELPEANAVDP